MSARQTFWSSARLALACFERATDFRSAGLRWPAREGRLRAVGRQGSLAALGTSLRDASPLTPASAPAWEASQASYGLRKELPNVQSPLSPARHPPRTHR